MTPLAETRLVATRETLKNLRGPKGAILTALAMVGGLLVALLATFQQTPRMKVEDLTALRDSGQLPPSVDFDRVARLIAAPPALTVFLEVSIWLAPALVWLAGFDGISGEVQHRTVRYWAGRARRLSYYVGKLVGLFLTIVCITFAMHALVWVVTVARGGGQPGETLSWGLRFWLATLPLAAAWCGIATLTGSLFRTPLTSLLATGFTFFGLFMAGAVVPKIMMAATGDPSNATAKALTYLYPNGYEAWLMHAEPSKVVSGVLACFAFVVVSTAAGATRYAQSDI